MAIIKGGLSWRCRPDGFAWNKQNGFFLLSDTLLAFILGSLLFLTALLISQQALLLHAEARQIHLAAMLGRAAMEDLRLGEMPARERVVGKERYHVEVEQTTFNEKYEKQEVTVFSENQALCHFTRLARQEKE